MAHIMGTVELSTSQVHAAQVLLRKIIPTDLNSVEVSAQPDDRMCVVHAVANANRRGMGKDMSERVARLPRRPKTELRPVNMSAK